VCETGKRMRNTTMCHNMMTVRGGSGGVGAVYVLTSLSPTGTVEAPPLPESLSCPKHHGEPLKLYCATCDQVICRVCVCRVCAVCESEVCVCVCVTTFLCSCVMNGRLCLCCRPH
jgi:hypothetical protein